MTYFVILCVFVSMRLAFPPNKDYDRERRRQKRSLYKEDYSGRGIEEGDAISPHKLK